MKLILEDDEACDYLEYLSSRRGIVIRPQTSGPCVHYDEMSEYVADAYPCTYPYGDGVCPHLDNLDVLCPLKDACYAMCEESAKDCAIDSIEEVEA